LASDITKRLQALGDAKTEPIRAVRRAFSKRLTKADASVVIQVALRLMEQRGIASRFAAYELICHHPTALRILRTKQLCELGRGIDSWGRWTALPVIFRGRPGDRSRCRTRSFVGGPLPATAGGDAPRS